MSTVPSASVTEARDAVSYFVSLHDVYSVDEQGFLAVGDTRITLGKEENELPVAIYNDPMPDPKETGGYWVLNPFSTKAQPSHAQKALYRAYRCSVSNYTVTLLKMIINAVLVNKEINVKHDLFDEELLITPEIRELSAVKTDGKKSIASEVDAKMFDEISALDDPRILPEFFTSVFIMAKLRSQLNIPFLNDPEWFLETANIKMRKKTIDVLKALVLNIFNVDSHEDFLATYASEAEMGEPARFASQIRNVYKIHMALNRYFVELDETMVIDLSILGEHIDNIIAYTKRAKMMSSEKIVPPKAAEKATTLRTPQTYGRRELEEEEERPVERRRSSLRELDERERRSGPPMSRGNRSPVLRGGLGGGRLRDDRPVYDRPVTRGTPSGRDVPSHLSGGGRRSGYSRPPVRDYGSRFDQVHRSAPFVRRS